VSDGFGEEQPADTYSGHVTGNASGQVVAGHHDVVVNAEGSTVSISIGPLPTPQPRRKPVGRLFPRAGSLLGRDSELRQLDDWIAAGEHVQVCGERGTGKSAVLRNAAARMVSAGADVVFLAAAGLAVEDVMQRLFQACYDVTGYRPDVGELERLMNSIEALIVIDDFEGSADDVGRLLRAIPSGGLIFAGTESVLSGQGQVLQLQGLDEQSAHAFLVRELGRELDEQELPAAKELWRATGGHPGALVQAAAATRVAGPGAVLLDAGPAELADVLASSLGSAARTTLKLLFALDGAPLPAKLGRALTGSHDIQGSLQQLQQARLVEVSAGGYRLSGQLAPVVAAIAGMTVDASEYAGSMVEWARTASAAQIAGTAPVLERVLLAAVDQGDHRIARDLARVAAPALALALHWGSWDRVLTLGQRAARELASAADEAYFTREHDARRQALGNGAAAGAAAGGVAAGAAIDGVAAGAATDGVAAGAATDRVAAGPATDGTAAGAQ
jgi:hypothetical protein